MRQVKAILQRLLARAGYQLARLEPAPPPSVTTFLRNVQTRIAAPLSVVGFDNDTVIQSELLEFFPANRVTFCFPVFLADGVTAAAGSRPLPAPASAFIAVIDIDAVSIASLLATYPWLARAVVLLLRSRLGSFWNEKTDLARVAAQIQKLGFELTDTLGRPRLSVSQAPSERVILACERPAAFPPRSTGSRYRINEALTYLSAPIVQHRDFQVLAGRGSFGFPGGVFNPGAITEAGRIYLLPQSERTPWPAQKTDESLFFAAAQPLLLTLADDHHVAAANEMSLSGLPASEVSRAGDFRLFRFRGQIYSNHFVMRNPQQQSAAHRPLQMEQMQTRVGLSRLDLTPPRLTWHGFPTLDRPLAHLEKNWAMFAGADRLFLLYSFSPYVLLSAHNWPELAFATTVEARLELPFDGDGLPLRNSINPVDYDDGHWLHLVHRVYPGKQYSFWAVLISKKTLLPVFCTARPLVRGWHSHPAAIIYTCSAVVRDAEVLLFSGLDDAATAVAVISRQRLDAEWCPLASSPAPTT